MSNLDNYEHYKFLTVEDLISIIKKKDLEIKKISESRDMYYEYNKFHIGEISRLDKIIGEYRKKYNS